MRHAFAPTEAVWTTIKEFVAANDPTIGVVVAQFNQHLTEQLQEGAMQVLQDAGVYNNKLIILEAPGAFELPVLARHLIKTAKCHAVICLGVVIQGDTPHFDFVCTEAARGIQNVALDTGCPVIFGVLTTNTYEQAELRANPEKDNKGGYAALATLQTLMAIHQFPENPMIY
jgi:6,7-dimethyl-8-ribityllumazine synthase